MSKVAFYPGSFNPFTAGHVGVVRKALKVFDKIVTSVISEEERYD
jgi:pantetheine-phosphate adenylyltransferase